MQDFELLKEDNLISDDMETLNDNFQTIASNYSGTSFPTENLLIGQTCFRTDLQELYRYTAEGEWVKEFVYSEGEATAALGGQTVGSSTNPIYLSNGDFKVCDLSSVYKYKGTVDTYDDLPTDPDQGDVYNVDDTGANYAWTGDEWDKLSETIDLSGYLTSDDLSEYATKDDLSSYLTTDDAADTYLSTTDAASTYLTSDDAEDTYLPLSGGTMTGIVNFKRGTGSQTACHFYNQSAAIDDESRDSTIYDRLFICYDKDSTSSGFLEHLYYSNGARAMQFSIKKPDSSGYAQLNLKMGTDGTTAITLGNQTTGSSTKPVYLNSGTITAFSSTIGGTAKPVYMSSGAITACSSTVGSGTKPVYMSSGTITVSSSTVGSSTKPVYLNSGTITAFSSTIGGTAKPVYMSSGAITACSSTVGSGTKPVYMSSGTITVSSSTVGSSSKPVYLNSGTITACGYHFDTDNDNCNCSDS